MSRTDDTPTLRVAQKSESAVLIEGDLTAGNADEFAHRLLGLTTDARGEITLDLHGLDIADGAGLAVAIVAIRQLGARAAKLILVGAPQMLAHNLYRVGLLGGGIELVDMRQDEPAGF